jgi:simple sugar transport system permease protein
MNEQLINILNSLVSNTTPLVIAALGETVTERAGVVNLSLDGSIALSAMAAFVAAYTAQQAGMPVPVALLFGLMAAMLASAIVALIVAVGSIRLRQDQVAIGFILFLLCTDLAQFLGQDYTSRPGPQIPYYPIPVLSSIPVIGPVLFEHNLLVYFSYILIFVTWFWMFRTKGGLAHRAVGERPAAAFARGVRVNRLRYVYAALGGALVGLAGAAYTLAIKPGWAPGQVNGNGWLALAIVIFGGWHPFRVVLGAYLFIGLRALSSGLQGALNISPVLLNMVPWVLMILTLLAVSSGSIERILSLLPPSVQRYTRNFLRSDPPAALGTRFEPD